MKENELEELTILARRFLQEVPAGTVEELLHKINNVNKYDKREELEIMSESCERDDEKTLDNSEKKL